MNIELAKQVTKLLQAHAKQQDEFLLRCQSKRKSADFDEARKPIAAVMASLFLDGLRPLYEQHPELVPDGLDNGIRSSADRPG